MSSSSTRAFSSANTVRRTASRIPVPIKSASPQSTASTSAVRVRKRTSRLSLKIGDAPPRVRASKSVECRRMWSILEEKSGLPEFETQVDTYFSSDQNGQLRKYNLADRKLLPIKSGRFQNLQHSDSNYRYRREFVPNRRDYIYTIGFLVVLVVVTLSCSQHYSTINRIYNLVWKHYGSQLLELRTVIHSAAYAFLAAILIYYRKVLAPPCARFASLLTDFVRTQIEAK